MPEVTQTCPVLANLLLVHGKVFFRHHLCNDSWLAFCLLLDQSMTKACVMTFGDICIFIF